MKKEKKVYLLMQKAYRISVLIGKLEAQLQTLNEALWKTIEEVYNTIEEETSPQISKPIEKKPKKKEKKRNIPKTSFYIAS